MELIASKKYTKERSIAYSIIRELKTAAATFSSDNLNHKDGKKYLISRDEYDKIIVTSLEEARLKDDSKKIVKEFINQKLTKA